MSLETALDAIDLHAAIVESLRRPAANSGVDPGYFFIRERQCVTTSSG